MADGGVDSIVMMQHRRPKVYLSGGDGLNWALDEDLRLTEAAIADLVDRVELAACDVLHMVWWESLLALPEAAIAGKRVICHMPNRPFHYLKQPAFRLARQRVSRWVVRSSEAQRELQSIGDDPVLIPYVVDLDIFRPERQSASALAALRQKYLLPEDRYVISNFHRDSEGADRGLPKLQKGPDLFLEIVAALHQQGLPIHVLLAGPRRHWLRQRLAERGLPFTFVGQWIDERDDLTDNILPRATLNDLYSLSDLYLVTSRWEGGPQSIMEAAAADCKIVSTRVGLAEDILQPECLYTAVPEAVRLIAADVRSDSLGFSRAPQRQRVLERCSVAASRPFFQALYQAWPRLPVCAPSAPKRRPLLVRLRRALGWEGPRPTPKRPVSRFALWHSFVPSPYGGGNQFMMALRKALRQRGVDVLDNELNDVIDACLLNAIHFDTDRFLELSRRRQPGVVQRVDGPICLYRGVDRAKDDLAFRLNAQFAHSTIVQSAWTLQRIIEMGYRPVNPVIVHNATDPDIFHRRGRSPFDPARKIRLISTSWSDNPRKGGAIYHWLDEHLDWSRYEYTFVGRVAGAFRHIRHVAPVDSESLADLLRQHDIYLAASQNDPCSNALIEALTCGLPALALNSGGHPELVGYGGLLFDRAEEIPDRLTEIAAHYSAFQNLITVPALADVADKYLALLTAAAQGA